MNQHMKNRFIILAGEKDKISPLTNINHCPMICILVKTLLEMEKSHKISLHIIVHRDDISSFHKTMKRWFPSHEIELIPSVLMDSSESLSSFLLQHDTWDDDTPCFVLQSDFPLLSKSVLDHFLSFSENKTSTVLGIQRTKWNEERHLHDIKVIDHRVHQIQKKPFEQYGFIPCMMAKRHIWCTHLNHTKQYYDVINLLSDDEKPHFLKVHSYPQEIDSIAIQSQEDRNFAQHKYLEREHADFLNQCYCIWSKCNHIEDRLSQLEGQFVGMNESIHNMRTRFT